jgi:hypothetical protein
MSTFEERLNVEHYELGEKIRSLSVFIESSKYKELSHIQKRLLVAQCNSMKAYLEILMLRIENL